jgi:predicted dehydrogenase
MPWFWRGDLQGGGVLNDMMCHSLEVGRYLLTEPGAARSSITPTKVSAQIATLKWSRPEYVRLLQEMMSSDVDYAARPAEDFARATVNYVDQRGLPLIVEATTSWSFVGAGLRLTMELLGPEYSMSINTLETGTKIWSRSRTPSKDCCRCLATRTPITATKARTGTSPRRLPMACSPSSTFTLAATSRNC